MVSMLLPLTYSALGINHQIITHFCSVGTRQSMISKLVIAEFDHIFTPNLAARCRGLLSSSLTTSTSSSCPTQHWRQRREREKRDCATTMMAISLSLSSGLQLAAAHFFLVWQKLLSGQIWGGRLFHFRSTAQTHSSVPFLDFPVYRLDHL